MANDPRAALDLTFGALTDATRRAILARLEAEGPTSISALARPLNITLPSVMKHLGVLEGAGLISRSKAGRVVTVQIEAQPMEAAMTWLRTYERFWGSRLEHLARYAEAAETASKGRK